jgi:hypothetical protein
MHGGGPDGEQTVPVEPPVSVELFPTHYTVMWTGGSLARFVGAVANLDTVSRTASAVVDDRATAGRERRRVADLETAETVRYLRVEPDTPWTVSWERRTRPVVSVSGTPSPALCRRVHRQTTDCEGWSDGAFDTLARVTADR